ncbi:MAG TPA: hypothetical protein VGJ38_10840 [Jatrophihabitantaceae bacterium]
MTNHGIGHRPSLPALRSDADLPHHWRALVGSGGFARRSLWATWFDENGASLPIVVPIDDVPELPDDQLIDNVMRVLAEIIDESEATSAAVLLSWPGAGGKGADDLVWARTLLAAARRQGVPLWPVHLATADQVQAFTPDDLAAAG